MHTVRRGGCSHRAGCLLQSDFFIRPPHIAPSCGVILCTQQRKGEKRMAWLDLSDQYDKIYRYCFFRLRDPDLAEDLTQETFLRFYRQISYEEEGKALAYLYTIARNLCLDAVRRARPAAPLRETDPAPDPFAPAEQRIALRQAIEKLPADWQELLLLRYANDLPVGQIAALTGLSRFAVHRRIRSALAALRTMLQKEDFA